VLLAAATAHLSCGGDPGEPAGADGVAGTSGEAQRLEAPTTFAAGKWSCTQTRYAVPLTGVEVAFRADTRPFTHPSLLVAMRHDGEESFGWDLHTAEELELGPIPPWNSCGAFNRDESGGYYCHTSHTTDPGVGIRPFVLRLEPREALHGQAPTALDVTVVVCLAEADVPAAPRRPVSWDPECGGDEPDDASSPGAPN
jgi:hypothetical protein